SDLSAPSPDAATVANRDAERDLGRQAGIVTAASAAVSGHSGPSAHGSLPGDVDSWGAAAGLTDLGGSPLASSSGPLSTVAQGRPVTGEAVRLSPGTSTEHQRATQDR